MTTRTTNLLAFMTDAPDGRYEVVKPTDEQLAAILPWLIDTTIMWSRRNGYCSTVNDSFQEILGSFGGETDVERFVASDGRDCEGYDKDGYNEDGYNERGYDREGFNEQGFNRNGHDREGYDRRGYDKDGYNRNGLNRNGETREQAIAKLVGGWSKEHLAAVAASLAKRNLVIPPKVEADAPAEESTQEPATAAA